jgi:hypothetical protein
MSTLALRRLAVACVLVAPSAASATSLTVVSVSAPDINCVFETDCTITVTDSVANIPLPNLIAGAARLQTRTFTGAAGAPAAGRNGYEYRVDLSTAVTNAEISCVTDLAVDFGEIIKLQYNKVGPADDVFVVTQGGLGKIGILFAEQTGNVVTFTFSQPVCAGSTPNTGDTTFFFGLTSAFGPKGITAKVGVPGEVPVDVRARTPNHARIPPIALPELPPRPLPPLEVPPRPLPGPIPPGPVPLPDPPRPQ